MVFSARVQAILVRSPSADGLPARIYVPIVALFAVIFLFVVGYLLRVASGSTGSALGPSASRSMNLGARVAPPQNVEVGGGPPPAVALKLSELRRQIATHPRDDVALVELGDLYLTVGKYSQAIPLYERALRVNPSNPAAKSGLDQARTEASDQPK
ncbi:MAG: tetratricopeptide repeat protein [Candidatus Eremiobacteraeota bacterium]|nr:tetratricopeptide repeat protein [Candidatus Eremiobacteraeota bacterium]